MSKKLVTGVPVSQQAGATTLTGEGYRAYSKYKHNFRTARISGSHDAEAVAKFAIEAKLDEATAHRLLAGEVTVREDSEKETLAW